MFNIGPQELLLVLAVALIIVGPTRLPQLSRQIGRGLRELRKVQDDVKDMVTLDMKDEPEPSPPSRHPSRRPGGATAAPGVHRTPRPAPPAGPTSAGAAADEGSDG